MNSYGIFIGLMDG